MPLSAEDRDALIGVLTNNEDTRAGKAWHGVDLDEATDEQLLAFNELHALLEPVENGISCPCGVTHHYNEQSSEWEYEGVPTNNNRRTKVPGTLNEFFQAGGGTPKDKEVHRMMVENYDKMHMDAFDTLTANATDELRTHLWEKEGYKNKSLAELQTLIQLLPKQAQTPGNYYMNDGSGQRHLVGNMFGAQGAPSAGEMVANSGVQTLDVPVLDFAEESKQRRAV